MRYINSLKERARALKKELSALALAYQDPRTPWYARAAAAGVIAYMLSPIDLIPDFIPLLGYLDDLVLIPLGIALAVRLIPPEVMADARLRAGRQVESRSPARYVGAAVIVLIWLLIGVALVRVVLG